MLLLHASQYQDSVTLKHAANFHTFELNTITSLQKYNLDPALIQRSNQFPMIYLNITILVSTLNTQSGSTKQAGVAVTMYTGI
jgi:hypothetical protein